MIRLARLIFSVSLMTVVLAAIGAMIGRWAGDREAILIASVMGTAGLLVALRWVVNLGWFDPNRTRGGTIGGLVGFSVGVPLMMISLDRPEMIVLGTLLVGVGVIVGAGPAAAR